MLPRFISILCALFVVFAINQASAARPPVTASQPLFGGGFYNITLTSGSSSGVLVKIIMVDEKGETIFKDNYNDAVEYYDGHMTSLVTRAGFSLTYRNNFGCYRNCISTSLSRHNPPLLQTFEYPSCGGESYCR